MQLTANRATAFSTALSFFDGLRTKDLPANLLQAQRDYFGAHTFRIKQEYASSKYPEGKVRAETMKL
jgi:6-phosphogluconate dehydrogenase